MNSKIKTNQIEYAIDRNNVKSRFKFLTIATSDKYIKHGSYILDAPALNNDVKSIVFDTGKKLFVMMTSDSNHRSTLKKIFSEIDDGSTLSVADTNVDELPDHILLQLLLNALPHNDTDTLGFKNLTGHFYYFNKSWIKPKAMQVPCLEFQFTKDSRIEMHVRTFTSELLKDQITFEKRSIAEYPRYVLCNDKTLRRRLSKEKKPGFILRQIDRRKTEITFMDIQNENKFDQSKIAMLESTIATFNHRYENIAHIDCSYQEVTNRIDFTLSHRKEYTKRILNMLACHEIRIVDQIDDNYSHILCSKICSGIKEKYKIDNVSVEKKLDKNKLNICVIHNKKHYKNCSDPHYDNINNGYTVQHVTLEDFDQHVEYSISTVIYELMIKQDLKNEKISLFDWNSLKLNEPLIFAIENNERSYFMAINPDGSFKIDEMENFSTHQPDNKYKCCINIFEYGKACNEKIRGLIIDSKGQINVIKDTGIITLPESDEIKTLLASGDTALRGKARREELLSSCLDIKTYEDSGRLYYFVGTIGEGMRAKIAKASNVRCIEGYNKGPILFNRLLPTMNIPFVHNNQLTVIPFPFKYLREYLNMQVGRSTLLEKEA